VTTREGSRPAPIASDPATARLRPVFQFPVAALGPAVTWPTALFLTLTSPRPSPPPARDSVAVAVTAALTSLRREQRQVLMCTFYGRLSADDAAARLGMPVRDVKRHARAALNEIRRVLTERGVPIPRQSALPA
jgi:DNA-directed RNA polymerase specialized sigma24 family protein